MSADQIYLGYVTGLVLFLAGVGLVVGRTAPVAAISLGVVLLAWVLLFHTPNLARHPRNGSTWTIVFETLALCGVAWLLAGAASHHTATARRGAPMFSAGRVPGILSFAVSLLVFGVLHLVYADFVATLIPVWIPARLFWAYFTGAAFLAAGVSIATGVRGRLAATLVGIMFGSWVLILHAPRVLSKLYDRGEWTSLFIAMAMCGGAWIVAESGSAEGT